MPSADAASALDTPFWRFSLDRYGRTGVPPLCLSLQDRHGADVNLVLFALWLGSEGRAFAGQAAADTAADHVQAWHARMVRPLRGVRRGMKDWPLDQALAAERDTLRAALQRVEIQTEQLEQAMLYRWSLAAADLVRQERRARADLMAANAGYFCHPAADGTPPDTVLARLVALCLD